MYRFIALLFALLMPLQIAWSAAAMYCQHETRQGTPGHIGHHEHVHKSEAHKADATTPDGPLAVHDDCGVCHAMGPVIANAGTGSLQAAVAAMRIALPPTLKPASVLARAPDRPQWLGLAPTARR